MTRGYEHGQLHVDLSGDDQEPLSADEVLGTFLGDLGVPGNSIPDSAAGKAKVFRSALARRDPGDRMVIHRVRTLRPGGER